MSAATFDPVHTTPGVTASRLRAGVELVRSLGDPSDPIPRLRSGALAAGLEGKAIILWGSAIACLPGALVWFSLMPDDYPALHNLAPPRSEHKPTQPPSGLPERAGAAKNPPTPSHELPPSRSRVSTKTLRMLGSDASCVSCPTYVCYPIDR